MCVEIKKKEKPFGRTEYGVSRRTSSWERKEGENGSLAPFSPRAAWPPDIRGKKESASRQAGFLFSSRRKKMKEDFRQTVRCAREEEEKKKTTGCFIAVMGPRRFGLRYRKKKGKIAIASRPRSLRQVKGEQKKEPKARCSSIRVSVRPGSKE